MTAIRGGVELPWWIISNASLFYTIEMEATMSNRFPVPESVERLAFLSDRVLKIADIDPRLSGSDRASLVLAAQLISSVRERRLERLAAAN